MKDYLIVKTSIKKTAGKYNVSSDFADALDTKARKLIIEAIARAEANGRRTVMGRDL